MTAEVNNYLSTKEHERARNLIFDFLREPGVLRGLLQIIKYALVGVANTLIDAAAYYALTRWLWLGSLPVLAKGIAYAIGMINSFYWNRNWTFRKKDTLQRVSTLKAALLFILTHIVALGINAGVMYLSLEMLQLSEVLALVLATGAAFGWNFILNKVVVFKA